MIFISRIKIVELKCFELFYPKEHIFFTVLDFC